MKICTVCKINKSKDNFHNAKKFFDGKYPQCKECKGKKDKNYYKQKAEVIRDRATKYYYENHDTLKVKRAENRDVLIERCQNYRDNNKEYQREYRQQYNSEHKTENATYRKAWCEKNRDRIGEYESKRLKTIPTVRLAKKLRNRLNEIVRLNDFNKSQSLDQYLGCTLAELKTYIENQFVQGMTWENYGEWHIDHCLALSNARNEEQMYKLSHFRNLAPKWKPDNIKKGNSNSICWQKIQRDRLIDEDRAAGYNFDLKALQFDLSQEKYTSEHREFIARYEWLGTVGFGAKSVFTARYEGKLAGVVFITEPNNYQFDPELEALISRGACSSWAPKNLNSRLVMFSCRWMTQNTSKRIFVAYSDPMAGEVGTIYQACNFAYLGQSFGSNREYQIAPGQWVNDRHFTRTSSAKKWSKELGITWSKEWETETGFQDVSKIPKDTLKQIRDYARAQKKSCVTRKKEPKGKYVLLLKGNKREKIEKKWVSSPYPKRIV
jgi:hypothetical protein